MTERLLDARDLQVHFPIRKGLLSKTVGHVYAVDIRTKGRKEWQNSLVRGYFRAMGFETLRHVGTADHLHVSLPPTGNRLPPP